jgi:hypothetical protein
MHFAGIAMFLFASSFGTPNSPQAALVTPVSLVSSGSSVVSLDPVAGHPPTPEGPPVISPDHAPPHPLKPRVTFETPATGLARIVAQLARGVLRDHGR